MILDHSMPSRQLDFAVALAIGGTDIGHCGQLTSAIDGIHWQPPWDWDGTPHLQRGRSHLPEFSSGRDFDVFRLLTLLQLRGYHWRVESAERSTFHEIPVTVTLRGLTGESVTQAAYCFSMAVSLAIVGLLGQGEDFAGKLAAAIAKVDAEHAALRERMRKDQESR